MKKAQKKGASLSKKVPFKLNDVALGTLLNMAVIDLNNRVAVLERLTAELSGMVVMYKEQLDSFVKKPEV